jgi:hypothetical protein
MIRVDPDPALSLSPVSGIEEDDDGVLFDPAGYRSFVEAVTGLTVSDDLTAGEAYTIANRIEAAVEAEYSRRGEWSSSLVEGYPDVESAEEAVAVAGLFRGYRERRLRDVGG